MGAVHIEQYIHTVQQYVAVQMMTILLLDQQWEQYIHTVHYVAVQMMTILLQDQQWEQYM